MEGDRVVRALLDPTLAAAESPFGIFPSFGQWPARQWAAGWEGPGLEGAGETLCESRERTSLRSKTERKGQGGTVIPKNKLRKILLHLSGL